LAPAARSSKQVSLAAVSVKSAQRSNSLSATWAKPAPARDIEPIRTNNGSFMAW
jgi:hypothetical protein